VPDVRQLVAEIGRLRQDRDAIDAMGAACARLASPDAAGHTARLIAGLIPASPPASALASAPASATATRAVSCART
jgi:hypothetical protein